MLIRILKSRTCYKELEGKIITGTSFEKFVKKK